MNLYSIFSVLITLIVAITYLNARFIKMQTTSAIMISSLLISLVLLLLSKFDITHIETRVEQMIDGLHFHDLLINGMLSFLLFAGALTIDSTTLKNQRWEIFTLASIGTVISVFVVAVLTYYMLSLLGLPLPFNYCILFGALISPTDPIAVLAMLTSMRAPKKLKVIIAGESLFNDGVGIIIFITAYQFTFSSAHPSLHGAMFLFTQKALGGLTYGAILGWLGNYLIRNISDHKLHILITVAITTGGYSLTQLLNISGPLAMVVAGMLIGNACRLKPPTNFSYQILEGFWEVIDELLNALLFLLIGFEILLIRYYTGEIIACLFSILLGLLARTIIIAIPMHFFKRIRRYPPQTTKILIWGGLRGGLAVALALSLPQNHFRDLILGMTYAIVVFAIIVQGTTIKSLVKRSLQ